MWYFSEEYPDVIRCAVPAGYPWPQREARHLTRVAAGIALAPVGA